MDSIFFKDSQQRKQSVAIIYEDDNLLVVNKPARLPVIPDRFGIYNFNLRDLLNKYVQKEGKQEKVWVIHRIDADTSGLVIFSKTADYHSLVNTLFEDREIDKQYLAIISGALPEKSGVIDKPILKSSKKVIIHPKGKESRTEYEVIEVFDDYGLVSLKPLSGRTHQIRVHLGSIGCPLAVDPLYGKQSVFYLSQIKAKYHLKNLQEPRPLCSRLTLHAHMLSFKDPLTAEVHHFKADLPKDMTALLKALRKYCQPFSVKEEHIV